MKIAVPKEIAPGERRVALVPESAARLVKSGLTVAVESGAGLAAFFRDADFTAVGALVADSAAATCADAAIVLKVQPPRTEAGDDGPNELELLPRGSILIGLLQPMLRPELAAALAARGVTAFSLDALPRTTRAQSMDVLSSMATVSGYKAALIAAESLPKFMPLLMTAAGTVRPARLLVIGAGVAGLQAIATARRLGAVVEAFDPRPAVREQVQSLGATFVDIGMAAPDAEDSGGYAKELSDEFYRREIEVLHGRAREVDAIIATAAIPGKPAPRLVTEAMVRDMKPGSVIVDLAAEMGGNCELTRPGETIVRHDVTIHGTVNLPSRMACHASQLYSRNLASLLGLLVKKGELNLDFRDEIIAKSCITHDGQVVHEGTKKALAAKQGGGTQ